MFANYVVIDGAIVTGQNQNAGAETAQKMMDLLNKKKTVPTIGR
jgi:putative intracellular protease/amidase